MLAAADLVLTPYGQRYALERIRQALRGVEPQPDARLGRVEVQVDPETGCLLALLRGLSPNWPDGLLRSLLDRQLVARQSGGIGGVLLKLSQRL